MGVVFTMLPIFKISSNSEIILQVRLFLPSGSFRILVFKFSSLFVDLGSAN